VGHLDEQTPKSLLQSTLNRENQDRLAPCHSESGEPGRHFSLHATGHTASGIWLAHKHGTYNIHKHMHSCCQALLCLSTLCLCLAMLCASIPCAWPCRGHQHPVPSHSVHVNTLCLAMLCTSSSRTWPCHAHQHLTCSSAFPDRALA